MCEQFSPIVFAQQQRGEIQREMQTTDEFVELVEYRTEYSKTFLTPNNEYVTKTFLERIHVWSNNQFVPIDNRIVNDDAGEFLFRNALNKYQARFRNIENEDAAFMKIAQDGAEIEISYDGQQSSSVIQEQEVIRFEQILPNVSLKYEMHSDLVKGDIILETAPNDTQNPFQITERIHVNPGTTLQQISPKEIAVIRNGTTLWSMAAPSIRDTKGDISSSLSYTLDHQTENEYNIIIQPDKQWLAQAQYPVTIDPDFVMGPHVTAYVEQASPNTATWPQRLMSIGRNTVDGHYKGQTRSYVKFSLPQLPAGVLTEDITRAEAVLYQYVQYNPYDVQMRKVTSPWNPATLTFHNQPSHVQERVVTHINGNHHYLWGMTDLVKEWYRSPASNNGVMFLAADENAPGGLFKSQYYPGVPEDQKPHIDIWHNPPHRLPHVPTLGDPKEGSEFGGTSTRAGQHINFSVYADDPDDNIEYTEIHVWNNAHEHHYGNVSGEGWQNWGIHLHDGQWYWEAKSKDRHGWGGTSPARGFLIDTTPPGQPNMKAEPEYTQGLQNEVRSTRVSDNLVGDIEYHFQRATDEHFRHNVQNQWTRHTSFGFSDLQDNTKYYYRVRSKDRLGNTTAWSKFVFSTQDATPPEFQDILLEPPRISPAQNDGRFDEATLTFSILEQYFDRAHVVVQDAVTKKTVQTHSVPEDASVLLNDPALPDGAYTLILEAWDKAGNYTQHNDTMLIIDNTPSEINISSPSDGAWFQTLSFLISGQVEHDSQLNITNTTTNTTISPNLSPDGIFESNIGILPKENIIKLLDIDNTGNEATEQLKVFQEDKVPIIHDTKPASIITSRRPNIEISLEDTGIDEYISGINPASVELLLITSENKEFVLVSAGQNVQEDVGTIVHNCSQKGEFGNSGPKECKYQYQFDTDLQPDGKYSLQFSISDMAGNIQESEQQFELDSHTFLEAQGPSDGNLYNYSQHQLTGTAERGATLTIQGDIDSEQFVIQPTVSENIIIEHCRPSENPSIDGIKEICDWRVKEFTLLRDVDNEKDIQNTILYTLTDEHGNTQTITYHCLVNVHAVNVSVDSDYEYFSPNNDGRQDGITFQKIFSDGQLGHYRIVIQEKNTSNIVKIFKGPAALPSSLYWDGTNENGQIVRDGDYEYFFEVHTTDGLQFATDAKLLYVKTAIHDEVVITSPKTESVTTRGVIDVIGQAPADTEVYLCNNVIGLASECDFDYVAEVNDHHSFARVIPLIRLPEYEITEHYIYAWGQDQYGNRTDISNVVRVVVDTQGPLKEVSIAPPITGINTQEQYEQYENGEIGLADVHTIHMKALATQHTEYIELSYHPLTNLEELEENTERFAITTLEGPCTTALCTYEYDYVVPPLEGGLYEIIFRAKKGETITEMTASVIIDGQIPNEPTLVDINTYDTEGNKYDTRRFQEKEYTNNTDIDFRGVASPDTNVTIIADTKALCTTTTSKIGIFTCRNELTTILGSIQNTEKTLTLTLESSDGNNTVLTETPVVLTLDQKRPEIRKIHTSKQWLRSGDGSDSTFQSNEPLFQATMQVPHGFLYDYTLSSNFLNGTASFATPGETLEGRYIPTIVAEDIAGNKDRKEQTFYIDNTAPHSPKILTEQWGNVSGYENKNGEVAKGRLVPGYVIRGAHYILQGTAEKNTKPELIIDGSAQGYQEEASEHCHRKEDDHHIDTVIVRSGEICEFSYEHSLADNRGHRFATRLKDRSGNISEVSEDVLLYSDNIPPITPELVGWNQITYNDHVIVRAKGEPKSDLHIVMKDAGSADVVHQMNDYGYMEYKFDLQEYGHYTFDLQSYDAAGNASEIQTVTIERTQPPPPPQIQGIIQNINGLYGTFNKELQDLIRKYPALFGGLSYFFRRDGAHMTFKVYLDGSSNLISSSLAPPNILSAYEFGENVSVHGSGINKYYPANVTIEYEREEFSPGLCWTFWKCRKVVWDSMDQNIILRNTKISLYSRWGGNQVGELWNDNDVGWEITLPRSEDLRTGKSIYAKTFIYDDFDIFIPGRGTVNIDYRYGGEGIASPRSNAFNIAEDLQKQIQRIIGIRPEDGISAWTAHELAWTLQALSQLPADFYSQTNLQSFRKEQAKDQTFCQNSNAFASPTGTELVICNLAFTKNEHVDAGSAVNYSATLYHELTHIYQSRFGVSATTPDNGTIVYEFYDILFDFDPNLNCWVESNILNAMQSQYSPNTLLSMFVSDYAYKASFQPHMAGKYTSCRRPHEFMAESVEYYILNPGKVVNTQTISYTENGNNIQQNLHIYEFIRDKIFYGREY